MIIPLEINFEGSGEVTRFNYTQILASMSAFCYEVCQDGILSHFEVFERKNTALCIDFEKRVYSETDFKEIYPKSKDFGIWAWTYKNLDMAMAKFNQL